MVSMNTDKWTVNQLVTKWDATKAKQNRAMQRLIKRQEREQRKAEAWKQNYKIAPHLLQLDKVVKCQECGCKTDQVMRKYRDYICGECGMSLHKRAGMIRPFAALVAGCLLLVLAGCQTPRMMNAEIQVAGQQVKVQVMR